MGTPDFALPGLEALIREGYTVSAVFTQPDKPKGRGMRLTSPPVKEFALSHNIPVFQPVSLKKETDTYVPVIKSFNPDFIVVIAYGKILPKEILDIPRLGCINVHGSLLPKYRGAAPIQWTVINGDEYGGVTTMMMAEGMDTGDMLLKKAVKVDENETSSEYYDRLSIIGAELLVKTLEGVAENRIIPQPQIESEATLAPMLSKEMSPTDFDLPARRVYNHINGLSTYPCATCIYEGKRLKLYRAAVVCEKGKKGAPGEIIDPVSFTVSCSEGAVRILELQAEGGRRMSFEDYLRGRPVIKGSILLKG